MLNALRPDAGSYNRLLVSLGILAFVAGFVLPWLLLRDTAVLELSRADLAQLTPTARETLIERQNLIELFQNWAWIAPAALIPAGIGLVGFGAVGLRSQQQLENRRLAAEVTKGERDATYEPQSDMEREEKLIDEAALDAPDQFANLPSIEAPGGPGAQEASPTPLTNEKPPESGAPTDVAPSARRWLDDIRDTEASVLERIEAVLPTNYSFQEHFKVSRGDSILLDALLTSDDPAFPDVVVEVKVIRSFRPSRMLMDEAISRAVRYRRVTGRRAWTWLIVVVGNPDPEIVERIRSHFERNTTPDLVQVTVVTDVNEIVELPKPALGSGFAEF